MSNYKLNREVIVRLISIEKTNSFYIINVDIAYNQINVFCVYPIVVLQKKLPAELNEYIDKKLDRRKKKVHLWLKLTNAILMYSDVRADGEDWSCVCGIKSGRIRIKGFVKPRDEIKSYHWYL